MADHSGRGRVRRVLAWRGTSIIATGVIVALGAFVAVRTIDTDSLVTALRQANRRLLGVAVGVYVLSWPLRGLRYDDILGTMGRRCGVAFSTAIIFLSQTANLVVPARAGDGARAYLLNKRKGVPYTTGGASLAVERLFDLLALAAVGALGGGWLLLTGRTVGGTRTQTFLLGAGGVAAVALVVGTGITVVARGDRDIGATLRGRLNGPRLSRVAEVLVDFGADVRVVAANPRAMARIGAGSLAVWALDVVTAVLVLGALAGDAIAGPALLAVGTLAVTVGNLAKVLPLSQGGIGLYEAAFTGLVVAATPVSPAVALGAAILDHGLKNAVTLVGGAGAAVGLNTSPRLPNRNVETADAESSDF